MSRLRLEDLSQDETLDQAALAHVRGGLYVGDQPALSVSVSALTCPVHPGPRYSVQFGQYLYDAASRGEPGKK